MRIWNEYEIDAYKYYEWFGEKANENIAEMSVCSINASGINSGNIVEFIDVCTKQITKLFIGDVLNRYKVYMFANKEISNPNSKVEQYMKVWKSIKKSTDIEGFIVGEELINKIYDLQFYTSIAEIPLKYLEKAIKIVISNPDRYTLFISKSDNVLSKEYIQHMFDNIIQPDNYGVIDYYKLALTCCMDGDIGVRYGTTFTEAELAFVYNSQEIGMQLF